MENIRWLNSGILMYSMPTQYETNRAGTTDRWVKRGTGIAIDADIKRVIEKLKDPLDWLFYGSYGSELTRNVFLAARIMLLQRYLYRYEGEELGPHVGGMTMGHYSLNRLLTDEIIEPSKAIDEVGASLDEPLKARS